jgi:pimeloyl-ACP methyl ester carboxylesterase
VPYADLAGLPTHYDVAGRGDAVVLLHGALAGGSSWFAQVEHLTRAGFRVWTPDRRGHGRTPDTVDPFSYAAMAEETASFIESVVGGSAHVVGWSDGAVVAALVALRRPDLVRRMSLIGQYYQRSGAVPRGLTHQLIGLRDDPPALLRDAYAAGSPDGAEHFGVVFAKTVDVLAREPEIPFADLARISAPTLVLQGDHDEVRLEHSAAVVGAIPDARLAVLPGTHALPIESPELVNALLVDFLRGKPDELPLGAVLADARQG